jgi:hypothetical protein
MSLREVPKILFEAELGGQDAGPGEGLVVAAMPGGGVCVQFCLDAHRIRGFSPERPPTAVLSPAAARALGLELLRELAPELMEALEARRPELRLVQGGGPEDAA